MLNLVHHWKNGPPCHFRHTDEDLAMIVGHHIRGFSQNDDQLRSDYILKFIALGKKKDAEYRANPSCSDQLAIMDENMKVLPEVERILQQILGSIFPRRLDGL